ncbi:hypothetical protein [Cellulomonas sp. P5_C5]
MSAFDLDDPSRRPRDITPTTWRLIRSAADDLASTAPPLSEEQRDTIVRLLGPAARRVAEQGSQGGGAS